MDALAAAVRRIGQAVSETLELKQVFAEVVEATATVLPFDAMGVCRLEAGDAVVLYAVAGDVADPPRRFRLEEFSPATRPRADGLMRIEDGPRELDPRFPADEAFLERGLRSAICAPLLRGTQLIGSLWLSSRGTGTYRPGHEPALQSIAVLCALALEHERLWRLDAERRRRLDAIDTLLVTLAEALDVREIFHRVSTIVQPVLPHDRLALSSLDEANKTVKLSALSGAPDATVPLSIPVGDGDVRRFAREYELIEDVEKATDIGAERRARLRAAKIRSVLRIPLQWVDGEVGALTFLSHSPDRYSEEDVVVARRVADHVSLALSHQRLAEEERRSTEARERAARLEQRVEKLREELETSRGYRRIEGESPLWKEVLTQAAKVAATDTTVLLTGESGTGKEVVARFVHRGSPRAPGPFVALNCAALPEGLLESELFGHERGAFTGADSSRPGRIEQAAGGVLFLDEVGEMRPALQVKLLRVLQEKEFQRLGGRKSIRADVRIIAATNRDLQAAITRGEFREDLYYRLCVFEIRLPPLRERPEDILPLAQVLLEEISPAVGHPAAGISRDAREALFAYDWPGNVRELRNALERATILCDGGLITAEHLPIGLGRTGPAPRQPDGEGGWTPPCGMELSAVEREMITNALKRARNNRSRAARLLGISRSKLYYRMRKHGMAPD